MTTRPVLKDNKDLFHALSAKFPEGVHTLGANHKQWARNASLDWEIKDSPVAFTTGDKKIHLFEGKKALWRSDSEVPLSIVGKGFQVHQPKQYLDFFGEMAERYGFKMAVAGSYLGGRTIWGCAETPHELQVLKGDKVKGALFMAGACDGTLATHGTFSSYRLWCLNQLPVLFSGLGGRRARGIQSLARGGSHLFTITHSAKFDPAKIAANLEQMQVGWDEFAKRIKTLQEKPVTAQQAISYFQRFFYKGEQQVLKQADIEEMNERSAMVNVLRVYETGEGQKQITGTAWGLVNAVTRYIDHETSAASDEIRVRKAWVESSSVKRQAFDAAEELVEVKRNLRSRVVAV